VFFLISGLGFHFQLEYCCGNLEELNLVKTVSIEVDECCGDQKTDDCTHTEEWVNQVEFADFQVTQVLQLSSPRIMRSFQNTPKIELNLLEISAYVDQREAVPIGPDILVSFQQFLI
jgi:hypothetical protein